MMLKGWRAAGVAFLAGALAALAMPPLYWLPLAIVGAVAFVWLWDTAAGPKSALLRGWAWGTGHFAVGSYWIVEAFFVPPADYGPLGPPIVIGLAALLGFFPGMAAGAAKWAVHALAGAGRTICPPACCSPSPGRWPSGCVVTSSPAMRGIPWRMSGPSRFPSCRGRRCSESMGLAC